MSAWSNQNDSALPVGAEAYTPKAGFVESWDLAYRAQQLASSQRGLAWNFEKADEAQVAKWGRDPRAVTSDAKVPRLREVADYVDLAKFFQGEYLPREDRERIKTGLALYDAAAGRASEQGRKVMPAHEVWKSVRVEAQSAEREAQDTPSTLLGHVGSFLASAVSSVDPRTDPLGFVTLPVGGVAKTVFGRVASQAGAQGAIEAVNQFTGVQHNRSLLGLEHGVGQALQNIALTAVGAGALQGVGEAAVGAAKWLKTPKSPDIEGAAAKPAVVEGQAESMESPAAPAQAPVGKAYDPATPPGREADVSHIVDQLNKGVRPDDLSARKINATEPAARLKEADQNTFTAYTKMLADDLPSLLEEGRFDASTTRDLARFFDIKIKLAEADVEKMQGGVVPKDALSVSHDALTAEAKDLMSGFAKAEAREGPAAAPAKEGVGPSGRGGPLQERKAPSAAKVARLMTDRARLIPSLVRMYSRSNERLGIEPEDLTTVISAVRSNRMPTPPLAPSAKPKSIGAEPRPMSGAKLKPIGAEPRPMGGAEKVQAKVTDAELAEQLKIRDKSSDKLFAQKGDTLYLPGHEDGLPMDTVITVEMGGKDVDLTIGAFIDDLNADKSIIKELEPCLV